MHLLNNGGEQNLPEYRKLNPVGGLPTLIHNDKVISQSFAIIQYLDEAFPQTYQLMPQDSYLKAKIRQVCENINADMHPLHNLRLMQYLEKKHSYNQEQKDEWAQKWIHDGLNATEKILTSTAGQYAFGDQVTAADLFIVPQLFSSERFKVDISKYPTLFKINKNCLQLEAFKKSHPANQIDSPKEPQT